MTSAIFDVTQILPAESDVIQNFRKFLDKSFRIVILHDQWKFGVDYICRIEFIGVFR